MVVMYEWYLIAKINCIILTDTFSHAKSILSLRIIIYPKSMKTIHSYQRNILM